MSNQRSMVPSIPAYQDRTAVNQTAFQKLDAVIHKQIASFCDFEALDSISKASVAFRKLYGPQLFKIVWIHGNRFQVAKTLREFIRPAPKEPDMIKVRSFVQRLALVITQCPTTIPIPNRIHDWTRAVSHPSSRASACKYMPEHIICALNLLPRVKVLNLDLGQLSEQEVQDFALLAPTLQKKSEVTHLRIVGDIKVRAIFVMRCQKMLNGFQSEYSRQFYGLVVRRFHCLTKLHLIIAAHSAWPPSMSVRLMKKIVADCPTLEWLCLTERAGLWYPRRSDREQYRTGFDQNCEKFFHEVSLMKNLKRLAFTLWSRQLVPWLVRPQPSTPSENPPVVLNSAEIVDFYHGLIRMAGDKCPHLQQAMIMLEDFQVWEGTRTMKEGPLVIEHHQFPAFTACWKFPVQLVEPPPEKGR